jgi:hypothetical protein
MRDAMRPILMLSACLIACSPERKVNESKLKDFATRYTAAWCSHDPAQVASFFAPNGSLRINDAAPSVGRDAIAAAANGFVTELPDLVVRMDSLTTDRGRTRYHWTLTGSNTGPGGGGRSVRISGYEDWRIGDDGLIAESQGRFDAADYARQLGRR